jgi:hypothetical protein
MKPMKIKMTDSNGNIYYWHINYSECTWLREYDKPKKVKGWSFRDHDGYERYFEGTWNDFVPYFNLIAKNYGFTCNIS